MCGSVEAKLPPNRQGVVKRMLVAMRENVRCGSRLAVRGDSRWNHGILRTRQLAGTLSISRQTRPNFASEGGRPFGAFGTSWRCSGYPAQPRANRMKPRSTSPSARRPWSMPSILARLERSLLPY